MTIASPTLSLTMKMQPGGWALPNDPNSMWGNLLAPMAAVWDAEQASMMSMLPQVDPRLAVTLLPAWNRMLGPDPCGRDLLATTLQAAQLLAYQRLTTRGGQSIPYFLGIAAAVGETATIQEGAWCRPGMMRTGLSRLSAAGNQFNWKIILPLRVVTRFRTGSSRARDSLGSFTASMAVCPITHAAPAHTIPTFSYTGRRTH
jgi:uncharacterized protein YmfQ (DUF2313 family)